MKNTVLVVSLIVVILAGSIFLLYSWSNGNLLSVQKSHTPVNETLSNQTITPGSEPYFSCPLETKLPIPIKVINTTGLATYTTNGVTDYVLTPGGSGSILYGLQTSAAGQSGLLVTSVNSLQNSNTNTTYLDTATLYHQTTVRANYTVTSVNSTNSSSEYNVCYTSPGVGTLCKYETAQPNSSYTLVSVASRSYPGISIKASALSTGAHPNHVDNLSILNVSASSGAPQGTYWMVIAGGPCEGGQEVLLTVGNSPYTLNSSAVSGVYS